MDRERFEAFIKKEGYSLTRDTREGRENGYWSSHTQIMWTAWQEALEGMEKATTTAEQTAAVRTLQLLGYTYHGGELWKPPLGGPRYPRAELGSLQASWEKPELKCYHCQATDGKHYCNCPHATPENRITGPAE